MIESLVFFRKINEEIMLHETTSTRTKENDTGCEFTKKKILNIVTAVTSTLIYLFSLISSIKPTDVEKST